MKKILKVFLVVLLLSACAPKNSKEVQDKYIKPINLVNFYEILNDNLKNRLTKVYGDSKVENNLFEMVGKELKDLVVIDYYDNPVYFRDFKQGKVIIEVVQNSCEHCKKQVPLTEEIMKRVNDITFVEYFAYGNVDQINEFYESTNSSIPKDVIIIPENKELSNFIFDLGVDSTPTFLFCENGIIKFAKIAELSYAQYSNAYDVSYVNTFTVDDLVTNDNTSVFLANRDYNDVLNDLSKASKDKLALIDKSEELTVNVIGQFVEFYSLYQEEEGAIYKLDSYTQYINKPLVVFYLGNIHDNMEDDITLINSFVKNHPDLNVLTLLMDTKDVQTSKVYQEMDLELECDYVSSNAEIPKQFLDTKVNEYLAALFIQENTFTGGVSGIKDLDTIERAYEAFIGDDSIALIKNNTNE